MTDPVHVSLIAALGLMTVITIVSWLACGIQWCRYRHQKPTAAYNVNCESDGARTNTLENGKKTLQNPYYPMTINSNGNPSFNANQSNCNSYVIDVRQSTSQGSETYL